MLSRGEGEGLPLERQPAWFAGPTRREHDLLGEREVPADAYWGIHTLRALENYPITGVPISSYPDLIRALACVKQAAAITNHELGKLGRQPTRAIVQTCEEIRRGMWHEQFVVDVIQGGAGTSTNMNANEVIANRGLEHLGKPKGAYQFLHPLEHVNLSQSTNDVYPTALKVGLTFALGGLLEAMAGLKEAFARKAVEFREVIKLGRTQLQDAVPMTLGQEFSAFALMVEEDAMRIREAIDLIREINLGATAIGTRITAPPGYAPLVRDHLSELTGLNLVTASNLVEATQDTGSFVQLSGVLKRFACKLSKICNDLRLLSSGPYAGLNEINLPDRAAGSSIMPGKVNPIIPEVVNQVAFAVIGNDVTVSFASEGGQLQLNAFEPIIAYSLFRSITHLRNACRTLTVNCVEGITANVERLRDFVENSLALATILVPEIGYEKATLLAREARETGRRISDLVLEKGWTSRERLAELLHPQTVVSSRVVFTSSF
ncbi:aspartate ammonia-lyase [Isosphaera pallida]|uniref:aspartate ammonia-lyase n=1 Tax=Isosphaera pallida TaxID=128 RepID=UPI0035CF08D9